MDELLADLLPGGWELDDELLVGPHDRVIDLDGACTEGCISPLRRNGLN